VVLSGRAGQHAGADPGQLMPWPACFPPGRRSCPRWPCTSSA